VEDTGDDSEKETRTLNILFTHEISYLRDPIFELHTLAELLSLREHNAYAVDYGREQGSGLLSGYQEMDVARVYTQAKVHLIRPPFLKIPVLGRLGYSSYIYTIYIRVLRGKNVDAIILYSAPTNGVQLILAAKKLGIPVVFRSIDVLHKLVAKPLALPTKMAEKWVYRHVDKILTITPALSRYVVKLGANHAKVGILPLGVAIDPIPDAPELKSSGLWGKTRGNYHTMVFAGTLPLFSGLDSLISQMPDLVTRIPNLRLLIVGDGVQRPKLEQMIRELGLGEQVKITGMVPHDDVPKWIAQADIGVLTFPTSGATRDIFPTKVLQYMACGKPVVANPLPGLVEYGLGEKQGVVYVRNGDWGEAIGEALANREVLGKATRRYVEQEHGYDQIVDQLEKELNELCGSH